MAMPALCEPPYLMKLHAEEPSLAALPQQFSRRGPNCAQLVHEGVEVSSTGAVSHRSSTTICDDQR
jgi:hypothetical protein